jgi:hypothetical protein
LQSEEIRAFGDGSGRVDGDESVFRTFFAVLIDETARVDGSHFGVVEGGDFFEFAGVGVAAVFGEAYNDVRRGMERMIGSEGLCLNEKKKGRKGDAPLALRGPLPWRLSFSTSSAARPGVWGLAPMKRIENREGRAYKIGIP